MSKKLDDLKILTDLTNKFLSDFINAVDPRDYDKDREYFIKQSLTVPCIISAEIIDKLSGTFQLKRKDILNHYIEKLKLALKWVDFNKNSKTNH